MAERKAALCDETRSSEEQYQDKQTIFNQCEIGNLSYMLNFLHIAREQINIQDESTGETLLHVCARRGYESIAIKILENHGVMFYLRDKNLNSFLHHAAKFGSHRILAAVLRKTSISHPGLIDSVNSDFATPLHLAIQSNNFNCADELLRMSAEISNLDSTGMLPLEYALRQCSTNNFKLLDVFLNYAPTMNQTDHYLIDNSVYFAVKHDLVNCLDYLVKRGFSINADMGTGVTPLYFSAMFQQVNCFIYLVQNGADATLDIHSQTCDNVLGAFFKDFYVEEQDSINKFRINLGKLKVLFGVHSFRRALIEFAFQNKYTDKTEVLNALSDAISEPCNLKDFIAIHPDQFSNCLPLLVLYGTDSTKRGIITFFENEMIDKQLIRANPMNYTMIDHVLFTKDNHLLMFLLSFPEIVNYVCADGKTIGERALKAAMSMASADMSLLILKGGINPETLLDDLCGEHTLLHIAISNVEIELVYFLLDKGANINRTCLPWNETPLHIAAKMKLPEIFIELIRRGADVMIMRSEPYYDTALDMYYIQNQAEVISLFQIVDLVKIHSFRRAMILLAHKYKSRIKFIDYIALEDNLKDFILSYSEDFSLYLFVLSKMKTQSLKAELIRFFKREHIGKLAVTATQKSYRMMIRALFNPNTTFFRFLLAFPRITNFKVKPCINTQVRQMLTLGRIRARQTLGELTLKTAVKHGLIKRIKLLLKIGVNPQRLLKKYVSEHDQASTILLIQCGASRTKNISPYNISLFQAAIIHGNDDMRNYFLDYGADINHTAKYGFTPLHDAVWARDPGTVQLLCEHRPDMDRQLKGIYKYSLRGSTPLLLATRADHESIIRILLQYGASTNSFDDQGRLPIEYAIERENFESIFLLITAGARVNHLSNIWNPNPPPFRCRMENRTISAMQRSGYNHFESRNILESASGENNINNANQHASLSRLYDPLSLQDTCAKVIRCRLQPNAWVGIRDVPIPKLLKSFVLFDITDEEQNLRGQFGHNYGDIVCRLSIHKRYCDDSDPILMEDM